MSKSQDKDNNVNTNITSPSQNKKDNNANVKLVLRNQKNSTDKDITLTIRMEIIMLKAETKIMKEKTTNQITVDKNKTE